MTSTRGWIPLFLLTLGLTDQAGARIGRITPDFRVQWVRVRKDGTIRY